jgi:hypothetical protein
MNIKPLQEFKIQIIKQKLDNNSWLVPRIAFVGYTCNKLGELTSEENNYFIDIFHDHRYYGTSVPNTGFGAVHPYFLDPKR